MVNQIMKIKPPAVKNMQINSVFGHRAITQMHHHVTDGQRGTDELTPVQKQEKRRFHRSHHGPHLPPDVQMDYVESEFPLRVPLLV